MKKNKSRFVSVIAVSIFLLTFLSSTGCKKASPAQSTDSTDSVPSVFISALVFGNYGGYGLTIAEISIVSSTGGYIRDANVTVNGATIPYDLTSEKYVETFNAVILSGTTVALNISSSAGNFSASAVMPAEFCTTSVLISGAVDPSKLTLSN